MPAKKSAKPSRRSLPAKKRPSSVKKNVTSLKKNTVSKKKVLTPKKKILASAKKKTSNWYIPAALGLIGIGTITATLNTVFSDPNHPMPVPGETLTAQLTASGPASAGVDPKVGSLRIDTPDGMGKTIEPWQFWRLKSWAIHPDKATMESYAVDWYVDDAGLQPIPGCAHQNTCKFDPAAVGTYNIVTQGGGKEGTLKLTVKETTMPVAAATSFSDAIPDWAADAVQMATRAGVIKGYADGTFGSNDPLSGGQFATMAYRVLTSRGIEKDPGTCPGTAAAVPPTHYAYKAFCLFLQGARDVSWALNPEKPMTRGEAAILIDETFGNKLFWDKNKRDSFKIPQIYDDVPASNAAFNAVFVMSVADVMHGMDINDTRFDPDGALNRAQAATVISRVLNDLVLQQ